MPSVLSNQGDFDSLPVSKFLKFSFTMEAGGVYCVAIPRKDITPIRQSYQAGITEDPELVNSTLAMMYALVNGGAGDFDKEPRRTQLLSQIALHETDNPLFPWASVGEIIVRMRKTETQTQIVIARMARDGSGPMTGLDLTVH